jgi:hypothetical protein
MRLETPERITSRMREIRTPGLMSGDGRRGFATAPILDSTRATRPVAPQWSGARATEMPPAGAIIAGSASLLGDDRHNRAKMTGAKPPEMEVGNLIAFTLDHLAQPFSHTLFGIHVEEDCPCVADKPVGPACDDAGSTMPASGSIHSRPKARVRSRLTMTRSDTAASAIT